MLRDSRKIFRLGKSLNEIDFIIDKITNELSFKITPSSLLEVMSKFGYLFYWLFDNLSILTKVKLLDLNHEKQVKLAMTSWFIGTFLSIIKILYDLNTLITFKQQQDPNKKDKNLDLKILNCYLNIIGKIGDLFPSGQGSGIITMLFGKPTSETSVGIGGFIAALVALRNAYRNC